MRTTRCPSIEETIALNLQLGRRTNPQIRCGGVSLNTAHLDDASCASPAGEESDRLGCAVADPIRGGAEFEAWSTNVWDEHVWEETDAQANHAASVAGRRRRRLQSCRMGGTARRPGRARRTR